MVNSFHHRGVDGPKTLNEPSPVDGTDFVEEHSRNITQPTRPRPDENFPGIRSVGVWRGDRSHDGDWAVLITNVILYEQRGARLLNFVADSGTEPYQVELTTTEKVRARLDFLPLRLQQNRCYRFCFFLDREPFLCDCKVTLGI